MSQDNEARELANKIMVLLDDKDTVLVHKALAVATVSFCIHEAKQKAKDETKLNWTDWLRSIGNNHIMSLQRAVKQTADHNDDLLTSSIIALPTQRRTQ